jgi:AcrR family transcriptional regulator
MASSVNNHVDMSELTERQKAVLDATLSALVEEGDALTMTSVSRRASCSKETLYKWFDDRDGLLTATVRWQASKVNVPLVDRATLDRASLMATLEAFARDWLTVISSVTSIALNRVAVSHAGSGKSKLGRIVLKNGRQAMERRLQPVLLAARDADLLAFDSDEDAFRTFFGLVLRDTQIRLLLGDDLPLDNERIAAEAATATHHFMAIHGRNTTPNREG